MAFAAYLLYNAMLVLARGGVFAHFFMPHRGVFGWTTRPHRVVFAAFPKKLKEKEMTNARGKVGWARLELPEPLLTKQKVKMAGYCPRSSVRFYGPSRG